MAWIVRHGGGVDGVTAYLLLYNALDENMLQNIKLDQIAVYWIILYHTTV